jgi:iron complex outermembrane recepter protein
MRTIRMLAAASVSLLALASPAIAQDTAAKDSEETGFGTGEIIVEARRRDESVQDVPLVVQAVTSQDLADLNIRQFQDIQALVPGLSLGASANGIGTQASIRGIAYDVNASGNNGTIEFYLNDAHLSSGMLFQSMYDVQQIEVLRGPQGTLRGRAAPSGSITVTTTKPNLSEAGGYVTAQVNDIGGWNLNGAINVPIIADKLAIRVAGIVDENNDNRVRSINNDAKPSSEMQGIRLSARFEPFDGLSLFGVYTHNERNVVTFDQAESVNIAIPGAPAGPLEIRAKDRLSVSPLPRRFTQNFEIFNWGAEWRAFGQKLNYVGAVNKQRLDSFQPSDPGSALPPGFPFPNIAQDTHTRSKEQFHEIRISSDERIAGIFDYVVGYLYDKLDSPTDLTQQTAIITPPGVTLPGFPRLITTPVSRPGSSKEESFFGNINAHIGEATELSGGVRFISYRSTGNLIINGLPVPGAEEPGDKKEHTIYTASLKHNFTDSFMAYGSFGTSWRPGSATNPIMLRDNTQPDQATLDLFYPDPETSESYEIGIKSDWFDRRLRVNISAFHQEFKNYAYSARNIIYAGVDANNVETTFTASPGIAVGVPAKVDGVEAEIAFQATPDWTLNATFAYAKSKIKNGTVPCNDYNPVDGIPDTLPSNPTYQDVIDANGGNQIATCQVSTRAGTNPPFSMTLQSDYNMPLSDSLDGYLRGLFTFYGKSQNDPTNPIDDVKEFGLLNLFAGIRDPEGAWDLGLYGKNVLDVLRVTRRNANAYTAGYRELGTAITAVSNYREIAINSPQEFGITFRANFGSR